MQCPICTGEAENLTPNTLDGVVVGCRHCGSYRISGAAFHDVTRLALEKRTALLDAAKRASLHGGWPYIATCGTPARGS